jgi:hypothetical protein
MKYKLRAEDLDLPHLRDGGRWRGRNDLPRLRVNLYLMRLQSLGMSANEAKGIISDLYWDCYEEMGSAGLLAPDGF